MKLLQRRSYKHLELFKTLMIAYFIGGAEQTRKCAKNLKKQVNERDCSELLFRLHKTATDEQIKQTVTRMHRNFVETGII